MPTSADSKNKCVANSSPVTYQTLRQQGGTGEDIKALKTNKDWNGNTINKHSKGERFVATSSTRDYFIPRPAVRVTILFRDEQYARLFYSVDEQYT